MVGLQHVQTLQTASEGYLVGLSDVLLSQSVAGPRLYTVNAAGTGILTLDPVNGLTILCETLLAGSSYLGAPPELLAMTLNNQPALVMAGQYGTSLTVLPLDEAGLPRTPYSLVMQGPGAVASAINASEPIMLGQTQAFVLATRDADGLSAWRDVGEKRLEMIAQPGGTSALPVDGVAALAQYQANGTTYVLALAARNEGLFSFRLEADGQLALQGRIEGRDGLAISHGTALEIVTLEGQTYALVGAAGTSSLAVVALGADGSMTVTDHVLDEATTRFQNLAELATITIGGHVFIAVAGSDDGVSLLTVLPGGRLVHLATLEDSLQTAMTNPSGIALLERNGTLEVHVTGGLPGTEAGSGITRLQADLGQIGLTVVHSGLAGTVTGSAGRDQLLGSGGNDHLLGGTGDDILVDGTGVDTLTGGPGRDIFVLESDAQVDYITDFERGTDRLDLADLGRFYTMDAIQFTPTTHGAEIVIGTERVVITTSDGGSLPLEQVGIGDVRDLTHLVIAPILGLAGVRQGDANANYLDGREGNDSLIGAAGPDTLSGGAGNDLLMGDIVDPSFDPASGQIFRLYKATLDRAPDVGGLISWTSRLMAGDGSLQSIASGFVNSGEFRNTYGAADNDAFVTLLYANVLDRTPDAGGLAAWVGALDSGARSREQVVLGFSESTEFKNKSAIPAMAFSKQGVQQSFADDVFRLYQATLDRAPDAGGFMSWVDALGGGRAYTSVISGFVRSAEFTKTYGATDNEAFVTLLYANVLDRAPDAGGLAAWLGSLDSGARSREQVVAGFAQSAEFAAKTAPDLKAWMRGLASDRLEGDEGNDTLLGGMFRDTFVFSQQDGAADVVVDFEPWDHLAFLDLGYTTASDVRSHMQQSGADVLYADQGATVRFVGAHLADMTDDAFVFL